MFLEVLSGVQAAGLGMCPVLSPPQLSPLQEWDWAAVVLKEDRGQEASGDTESIISSLPV